MKPSQIEFRITSDDISALLESMESKRIEFYQQFGDEIKGFALGPREFVVFDSLKYAREYSAFTQMAGHAKDMFRGVPIELSLTPGIHLIVDPGHAVRLAYGLESVEP